jgi:hypothetical protein
LQNMFSWGLGLCRGYESETDIHQMGRRFKPNMQPFRVPGKPGLPPTCW